MAHLRAWNPAAEALAQALTVGVPDGTKSMVGRDYYPLLADRVERMIRRQGDPRKTLDLLIAEMQRVNLLEPLTTGQFQPPSLYNVTQNVIAENPALRDKLSLIGLPAMLGKLTVQETEAARRALRETTLPEWMDLVLIA